MALTYFSITAHMSGWQSFLKSPGVFHPAGLSEDGGYLTVDIERGLSRLFSQAQASFEYTMLWFWLGKQGLGGLHMIFI